MTYNEAKILFSEARMRKYLAACYGDKQRTMMLYLYATRLAQTMFGVIGVFEITFRNAVNYHYLEQLGQDWIINQTGEGKIFESITEEIKEQENKFLSDGTYSHDKMVGTFTFGFWAYLFTRQSYKLGGKTLLQIFPNKEKGMNQKQVYNDINKIRKFRNRVAHHEPICFNKIGDVDLTFVRQHYELIRKYLYYMGKDVDNLLGLLIAPDEIIKQMDILVKDMNMSANKDKVPKKQ